jgi:selenophosphate synthase
MYTVVRVAARGAPLDELAVVGSSMNELRPGVFRGIREAGDGFSCDVCDDDGWERHAAAISHFAHELAAPLRRLIGLGAVVTFDVAVEPEDREGRGPVLVLRGEASLLALLGREGFGLEVSVYG